MKRELSHNEGYRSFIEVTDVLNPVGYKYIKITSTYEKSRIQDDERVRFEMLLSPETLKNFKDILNESS